MKKLKKALKPYGAVLRKKVCSSKLSGFLEGFVRLHTLHNQTKYFSATSSTSYLPS